MVRAGTYYIRSTKMKEYKIKVGNITWDFQVWEQIPTEHTVVVKATDENALHEAVKMVTKIYGWQVYDCTPVILQESVIEEEDEVEVDPEELDVFDFPDDEPDVF
jgi:hypothetical protein